MDFSINYKKLLANKYVILVIALMILSVLYSLFNELQVESVIHVVGPDIELSQSRFSRMIDDISEVLEKNPKNYAEETKKPGRGEGAFFTSLNEVQIAYNALSYHKSWLLNRILIVIMRRGQVYMAFIGILLATATYANKESFSRDKAKSAKKVIKNQIYRIFIIIICILIVGVILGLILGNVMYSVSLNETEQIKYLNNLFITENIWTPDIIYTAVSVLGGMLYLFTYAIWGLFIGHIIKDRVFALLLVFLTANQWFLYAITTPIAPMYFLHRIISKFIFIPGGFLITIPDFKYYYILILLIFLTLMLLISQKLLNRRFTKTE